jgi:uncharacterized protein (UPF0335 family)
MTIQIPSDGQPLTYELLKQIIEQVNRVSSSDLNDVKQIVNVYGEGISQQEDAKAIIVTGERVVSLARGNNSKTTQSITFPAVFSATPYVTVTIVDVNTAKAEGGVNGAVATVVALSKIGMTVKVELLKEVTVGTTIRVHYMAVGPGNNN